MVLDREATWGQVWEQLQVLFWLYAGDLGYALSPLNVIATLGLCLVLWRIAKPGQGTGSSISSFGRISPPSPP